MKKAWILLCAAALALSACAPASSGASAPSSGTPVSDATDAVYENLRILTVDEARADVQAQIDDVERLRDSYGGSDIRYINLAGTVAAESLGEEFGTLTLRNAAYDAGGVNALPDGASAVIEWNVADDSLRVIFQDASGATLLELERAPDGEIQFIAGALGVTRMAGPGMKYENLFLNVLSKVDSYAIKDGKLMLKAGPDTVAVFMTGVKTTK